MVQWDVFAFMNESMPMYVLFILFNHTVPTFKENDFLICTWVAWFTVRTGNFFYLMHKYC